MKINKAKLLVGTLAVVATAATVGSISGTVAWFQYSTRSTVSYTGASAHCTENLQVRIYDADLIGDSKKPFTAASFAAAATAPSWGKWASDLRMDSITSYIKMKRGSWNETGSKWDDSTDDGLYPVTSGVLAEDAVATTLKRDPIRGYEGMTNWKPATTADYVDLPLQFRVVDVNGKRATGGDYAVFLEKKLYLSDLTIANGNASDSGKLDISPAIRVAFPAASNTSATATTTHIGTFWNGASAAADVDVHGPLDLNGDGINDRVYKTTGAGAITRLPYDWELEKGANISVAEYGDSSGTGKAVASPLTKGSGKLIADDSNPYGIVGNELCTVKGFDTTKTVPDVITEGGWTTINVRIYLEGWQKLSTTVAYTQAESSTKTDLETELAADSSTSKLAAPNGYYKLSGASGTVHYWNGTSVGEAVTGGKDSVAVWNDLEYVASKVNIGMTFAVDAHAAQGE